MITQKGFFWAILFLLKIRISLVSVSAFSSPDLIDFCRLYKVCLLLFLLLLHLLQYEP